MAWRNGVGPCSHLVVRLRCWQQKGWQALRCQAVNSATAAPVTRSSAQGCASAKL